jgi:hypothetical protein
MADELSTQGKALVAMVAAADVQQNLAVFMKQASLLADSLDRFVKAFEALSQYLPAPTKGDGEP